MLNNYNVTSSFSLVSVRNLQSFLKLPIQNLKTIADKAGLYYNPFDIAKKDSDQWRHIDNPNKELKYIQTRIKNNLLELICFPEHIIGGVKGKSIKTNATYHLNKRSVITIDLKNCYPRIDNNRIFDIYRKVFGCSTEIANLLTKLTTFQRRLPQGAPTSSLLANLALLPLYNDIMDVVKDKGVDMTFYVDDITLSGEYVKEIIGDVIKVVQKHGVAISNKKSEYMLNSSRQKITGIVTNTKLTKPKEYIDAIRREILGSRNKVVTKSIYLSLKGRINHVSYIDEDKGKKLFKLFAAVITSYIDDQTVSFSKYKQRPCKNSRRHKQYYEISN